MHFARGLQMYPWIAFVPVGGGSSILAGGGIHCISRHSPTKSRPGLSQNVSAFFKEPCSSQRPSGSIHCN